MHPPDQSKFSRTRRVALVLALAASQISLGVMPAFGQAAAEADMAILGVSDSPDPVTENRTVAYGVSVGNFGPDRATGVQLTTSLPTGVRFEPSESSSSCSESGGTVTCSAAAWDVDATGIVVTLRFPPGLRPAEGELGSCTEDEGGTMTCQVAWGSLPSGAGSV